MPKNQKHQINEHVQIVTSGSNIRFEPVKSNRTKPKQHIVVNVAQEVSPVGGFLDFLKEHAVASLIIGFVLGTQVQTLVKQLVQSFIDPMTQLLFGTAISQRSFQLHFNGRYVSFAWGAMVYSLVIFFFVVLCLYLTVRFLRLDKLEKKKKASSDNKTNG